MSPDYNAVPGMGTEREAGYRALLKTDRGAVLKPGGVVVDGSLSRDPGNTGDVDVLRAGLIIGKVMASGLYAPSIIGVLLHDEALNSVALEVDPAVAVELVRRIGSSGTFGLYGNATAGGDCSTIQVTYSAVDTVTGVITCSALSAARIAGSYLMPEDGSEVPAGFVGDGYGVKVTDEDSANIDAQCPSVVIGGYLDHDTVVNYPADTGLNAYLRTWMVVRGLYVTFDDIS